MRIYGLLGYPLAHSFSPDYFAEKFEREAISDAAYRLFPLKEIDAFPGLIEQHRGVMGLNVTIPHKRAIMPLLDSIDGVAKAAGSVNTIVIDRSERGITTTGYNTDVIGFRDSLRPFLKGWHHKALILGTGGSSGSVNYVLNEIGLETLFVSRNPSGPNEVGYEDLNEEAMRQFKLIVNTTPVGMHPKVNLLPDIPYEFLSKEHLLFDLIYNPRQTEFLRRGRANGAEIINGERMLQLQAEASWKLWQAAAQA